MPMVVPVKFAYATRDLWFDASDLDIIEGDYLICATERGTEIGLCTGDPFEASDEDVRARSSNGLKPVLRIADDDDLDWAEEQAEKGDDAYPIFRRIVSESGLDIKPVGVEYLFGGEKVVCYFAAEERVDFRQLVRDLSRELHDRIDMRQIGVREEAALVGGFAHCGQELCCARFGRQFEPVSIRMAKEQDLPLNSTKISGVCGRLMCCLRYEFEAYRDFKSRAPKRNAVIQTPLGTAKIIEYDTPKEQLALRLENGKVVRVPLAGMTCSEAACAKSKELGCPCRPDTVPRETLDEVATTDIQLALTELDRKAGVLPEEASDDLFDDVARTSTRRKRRRSSGAAEAEQAQAPEQASEQPSRRKRRRASEEQDAAAAETPAKTRRRRHHRSGEDVVAEEASAEERSGDGSPSERPKKGMQPRRRRKPGDQGGAVAEQREQQAQPAAEGEQGDAPKKRRRRRKRKPGGEGAAAAADQQAQNAQGSQAAPSAASDGASGETGEGAPKKRRRRRRRKPSGGGGEPSSE